MRRGLCDGLVPPLLLLVALAPAARAAGGGSGGDDAGWLLNFAWNALSFATLVVPAALLIRYLRAHPEHMAGPFSVY